MRRPNNGATRNAHDQPEKRKSSQRVGDTRQRSRGRNLSGPRWALWRTHTGRRQSDPRGRQGPRSPDAKRHAHRCNPFHSRRTRPPAGILRSHGLRPGCDVRTMDRRSGSLPKCTGSRSFGGCQRRQSRLQSGRCLRNRRKWGHSSGLYCSQRGCCRISSCRRVPCLQSPPGRKKSPADTPNDHRKAATMRQKSPKTHSLLQRPDIGFGGLLGLLTAAIAVVRGLNAPELSWCLSATLVYARFVSAVSAALNGVWNSRLSQLTMIYGVLTLLIFLASSAILQINPLSAAVLVALTSFPIDLLIQSLRKKGATPR